MSPVLNSIAMVVGLSSVSISSLYLLFSLPVLKKRHAKHRISREKLKIIANALEHSDQRIASLQERHDALLHQVCSHTLFCNRELHEALLGARKALIEASEFAASLRRLQMAIIASFPDPPPETTSQASGGVERSFPGCALCNNRPRSRR